MKKLYPGKSISGCIEVLPNVQRETAVDILAKLIGVEFVERESDEFVLIEANRAGYFIQFQINHDWDLTEDEKKGFSLFVNSFTEERDNSNENAPEFLIDIPRDLEESEHGHIDISKHLKYKVELLTGYKCQI